ncbi:hypothetical protein EVAR_101634_1 [Eumeta japonica]|uniref:Reverse transcriptase zinc-binding domain-containing protein n=1 Tax=Eumeta variegata TaxID=151549 RepID=A0A4C2AAU1_EUMVA|nr:hypothetical protein EVAR_101634_1 [Eumeta japonica]
MGGIHHNRTMGMVEVRALEEISEFDARRAEFALKLDRKNHKTAGRALTGHYTCNKHLHRMELSGTGTCRFCGMEEASMEHLIADCLALGHKRYRIQNATQSRKRDF